MLGQAGQPTAGVESHPVCEDDRRRIDEGYRNLHPKVLHYYIGLQRQAFCRNPYGSGLWGCINSGHNRARVAPEDHS